MHGRSTKQRRAAMRRRHPITLASMTAVLKQHWTQERLALLWNRPPGLVDTLRRNAPPKETK